MVSNASDDLPEPDSPVIPTSWARGISRSTFLRLCSRAPRMTIRSLAMAVYYTAATSTRPGGDPRQRRGGHRRVRTGDAGPRGQPEERKTPKGRRAHERTDDPGDRFVGREARRDDGRRQQAESDQE